MDKSLSRKNLMFATENINRVGDIVDARHELCYEKLLVEGSEQIISEQVPYVACRSN